MNIPRTRPKLIEGKKASISRFKTYLRLTCLSAFVNMLLPCKKP